VVSEKSNILFETVAFIAPIEVPARYEGSLSLPVQKKYPRRPYEHLLHALANLLGYQSLFMLEFMDLLSYNVHLGIICNKVSAFRNSCPSKSWNIENKVLKENFLIQ
jgi:hypothetical protein